MSKVQMCINWFLNRGIYAQNWGNSVIIVMNNISIVISDSEIECRAEMFHEESIKAN